MSDTPSIDQCYAAEPLTYEQNYLLHLERDRELLNHGCFIEVAVRNPSVADHMKHWEGRAIKAETELAATRVDAERYREARNNVGGYVHLLNLMLKPGATGEQLDKMMDRIAESRRNSLAAIDAAREKTK